MGSAETRNSSLPQESLRYFDPHREKYRLMNGIGPGESRLEKKNERKISVATDGFDPGVFSPPPIPSAYLRASKEMHPWGMREWGREEHSILHKHDLPCRPRACSLLITKGREERCEATGQLPSADGPPRATPTVSMLRAAASPLLQGEERAHLPIQKKKVASVGERHMSGLHREPCAWQENAMPIPAPAFHSCCNSHKRLLKPKKNKTVILIKQHSGTLKTRWRLLRPTLKLYSLFQELHFVCAGGMDAGRLTPMGWGISEGKGQEAALQHSSHPVPKYRETSPSPGSRGPLLKASLDIFSPNAFFSRCPDSTEQEQAVLV